MSRSRRREPTTSWGISALEPNDDSAGGCGGRGPQPRHGAVAALDRRSVPARPERAQCIAIAGRGRPSVGAPRAGRAEGAPAAAEPGEDAAVRAAEDGRRGSIAAWNEPAARRPSRRSRARDDGRTNRAAGRAAYFAAMLSLHGRQWYRVRPRVASDDAQGSAAASGVSAPRASARAISRSAAAT